MKLKFKFSSNWMNRFLDVVEKGGNVLPHPATLFALMALSVIVLSGIAAMFDISAIHPGTGETIKPVSLLSGDGLRRIISEMVRNFTGFAPLGTVLVALLGHRHRGRQRPHRRGPPAHGAVCAIATADVYHRFRRRVIKHGL